jgi:hypothetical protein
MGKLQGRKNDENKILLAKVVSINDIYFQAGRRAD